MPPIFCSGPHLKPVQVGEFTPAPGASGNPFSNSMLCEPCGIAYREAVSQSRFLDEAGEVFNPNFTEPGRAPRAYQVQWALSLRNPGWRNERNNYKKAEM